MLWNRPGDDDSVVRLAVALRIVKVPPGLSMRRLLTMTGICVGDRAFTRCALAARVSRPLSFRRPGQVLSLKGRNGGVRKERWHTESTIGFAS